MVLMFCWQLSWERKKNVTTINLPSADIGKIDPTPSISNIVSSWLTLKPSSRVSSTNHEQLKIEKVWGWEWDRDHSMITFYCSYISFASALLLKSGMLSSGPLKTLYLNLKPLSLSIMDVARLLFHISDVMFTSTTPSKTRHKKSFCLVSFIVSGQWFVHEGYVCAVGRYVYFVFV